MTQAIARGLEIVPGYVLVRRLGSGMAGEVWVARASGGVHVAIKLIRDLQLIGSKRELGALRIVREVKHPNLCPLIGVWFFDADGELLTSSETDDILGRESSLVDTACLPGGVRGEVTGDDCETQAFGRPQSGENPAAADTDADAAAANQTMAAPGSLGGLTPTGGTDQSGFATAARRSSTPAFDDSQPIKAAQMIVAMGLGEKTLHDRLVEMRAPGNQPAPGTPSHIQLPGGIPVVELMRYLTASASAIDELNQHHKIFHCDIKPQNILIVGGQAQVCDFGLARQVQNSRKTQLAIGTPAYGAPEMIFDHMYSETIDQYSLAVTYYELRTGQLPFETSQRSSFLRLKASGELNLGLVGPAEQAVLAKASHLDPKARYFSCGEFTDALAAAIAASVPKPRRKLPVKSIIAAATGLSLMVGVGVAGTSYGWRNLVDLIPENAPTVPVVLPKQLDVDPKKGDDGLDRQRVEPGEDVITPPVVTPKTPETSEPKAIDPGPGSVDPVRQRARLAVDFGGQADPGARLQIANESLAGYLSGPSSAPSAAEVHGFLGQLRQLLPLPDTLPFDKLPPNRRRAFQPSITASLASELHQNLMLLRRTIARAPSPSALDQLHDLDATRLQLSFVAPSPGNTPRDFVDRQLEAIQSAGEIQYQPVIKIVGVMAALNETLPDRPDADSARRIESSLSTAMAFVGSDASLDALLRRKLAEQIVALENSRYSADDPLRRDLTQASARLIGRLKSPLPGGPAGRSGWDVLSGSLAAQARLAAGAVAWDQSPRADRDAIQHWLALKSQADGVGQTDRTQRRRIAANLLVDLVQRSGVDDTTTTQIRYADRTDEAAGVLELCEAFLPNGDDLARTLSQEQFLLLIAKNDFDAAARVWSDRGFVARTSSPQVGAAAMQLAGRQIERSQRSDDRARWVSVFLGSVVTQSPDAGASGNAGASTRDIEPLWSTGFLPGMEHLRSVCSFGNGRLVRPSLSLLRSDQREFCRRFLAWQMLASTRDADDDYLAWLESIETAAAILSQAEDDPDEQVRWLGVAYDAYLQQRLESPVDTRERDLIAGLVRYRPSDNLLTTLDPNSPSLNYLMGHLNDQIGMAADSADDQRTAYGLAKTNYDRVLGSPKISADVRGEMLRSRADVLWRLALGESILQRRQPFLEQADLDAVAALAEQPRWYLDSHARLETYAKVVWHQILANPRLSPEESAQKYDQLDELVLQTIADRKTHSLSTVGQQVERLNYIWNEIVSEQANRPESAQRKKARQTLALTIIDGLQSDSTVTVGGKVITGSIKTESETVRCQWHRNLARIFDVLQRSDDATRHAEFARHIAATQLPDNQVLVHLTILEQVFLLEGQDVPRAERIALVRQLIADLESIRDGMPEIMSRRDSALKVLQAELQRDGGR